MHEAVFSEMPACLQKSRNDDVLGDCVCVRCQAEGKKPQCVDEFQMPQLHRVRSDLMNLNMQSGD